MKIRPPLTFSQADAAEFLVAWDADDRRTRGMTLFERAIPTSRRYRLQSSRVAAEQAYAPAARQALASFGVAPADLHFVHWVRTSPSVTDARDGSRSSLRLHRPWYHDIVSSIGTSVDPRPGPCGHRGPRTVADIGRRETSRRSRVAATGERRWAGLARWGTANCSPMSLRGKPTRRKRGHFAPTGDIMATMHDQATAGYRLRVPTPCARRGWPDGTGAVLGARSGTTPFSRPPNASLLLDPARHAARALIRYGGTARTFSLIHADLHPRNVVIDGTHAAVIDFDDTGFGWHQYRPGCCACLVSGPSRIPSLPRLLYCGISVCARDRGARPRIAADVPADPRHGADRLVPSATGTATLA